MPDGMKVGQKTSGGLGPGVSQTGPSKTQESSAGGAGPEELPAESESKVTPAKKPGFGKPGKPAKLRVKLPTIESYEKELEFQADAPGRVVVRLERLMGTDRVRITDPKYMSTLLKRLEEEEQKHWDKRSRMRKKAERDRFRQLAIDGQMEPGRDMLDLYHHPVFRVNRILKRLSKLDDNMSTNTKKLAPILAVEPFDEYEQTGLLFGFHKNHYMKTEESFRSNMAKFTPASTAASSMADYRPPRFNEDGTLKADSETDLAAERAKLLQEWGGEDYYELEDADLLLASSEEELPVDYSELLKSDSLTNAKAHYGIQAEEDLDAIWKAQRSPLIDQLYSTEMEDAATMMNFSKEVLGTYKREQAVADNFITKVHRKHFQN